MSFSFMYLSVFLLGFILPGTLHTCFLDLVDYFLSHVREVLSLKILSSAIISSNIFSSLYYLFSSSGTPIMWMLVHLMLSQRSLRLSSFLFILFSIFFLRQWFPPFCPPDYLSFLPQLFCYWFLPVYCSCMFLFLLGLW